MLYAPFGYKIMFTFDNPDGTINGGICGSIQGIEKIFKAVAVLGGSNLVIRDETIYKEKEKESSPSIKTDL